MLYHIDIDVSHINTGTSIAGPLFEKGQTLVPPLDEFYLRSRPLALYAHRIAVVLDKRAPIDHNSRVERCPEYCTIRLAAIPLKPVSVIDFNFRVFVAVDDAPTVLISPITLECRATKNDRPAGCIPTIARRQIDCSGLCLTIPEDGGGREAETERKEDSGPRKKCCCCCTKPYCRQRKNCSFRKLSRWLFFHRLCVVHDTVRVDLVGYPHRPCEHIPAERYFPFRWFDSHGNQIV